MGVTNTADVERSLLASMMDAKEAPNIAATLEPEDFSYPQYRVIYVWMRNRYEQDRPIDLVVMATELNQNVREVLDIAGFAVFAKGNVVAQIEKLKAVRIRRELIELCQRAVERLQFDDVESVQAELMQGLAPKIESKSLIKPKDASAFALEVYCDRKDRKGNGGIPTGFSGLDRCLNGGAEPGQLIILAAPTKKGKSAFALNVLRNIGINHQVPTLLVNTELSQEQVSLRTLSILSQVDHSRIATGQTSPNEDTKVMDAVEELSKSTLYTLHAPDLTVLSLTSFLRQYSIQYGIKFACVDYIGRIDTQDAKLQEWQVLRFAAKRLKTLAQQLKISILMVAQINEDGQLEGAKAMRNECDLFAHLRPMTDKECGECSGFNYVLVIESNRSGPQAKIPLQYRGETLTFTDWKATSIFDKFRKE